MPSQHPAPSTCSGTTCSLSPTSTPPIPRRRSTSVLGAPRYSPNGLQARGRVVRCYLQVCYIVTEPDTVATAIVATDTPAPTSPASVPSSHTSSHPSDSTPLPPVFKFADPPGSETVASAPYDLTAHRRRDFATAAASSSSSGLGLVAADPATASTAPSGTFWDNAIERRSGATVLVPTSMPTLHDPPTPPALDVAATSSDSVSPTPTPTPTPTPAPSTGTSGSKLSTAAIVRITIGAAVGAGFLAIALICFVARWRNSRRAARLAARRKPFAGPEAYGMASRAQAEEGHMGLGRASSDSSTVVDHDGYGGEEFGMAGGAHGRKDRERV